MRFGFANSNDRPPTEVEVGTLTASAGVTSQFDCALLDIAPRSDLPDLNLSALVIRDNQGTTILRLENTGNTYYFFQPKPLPPGLYDVAIEYTRSAALSVMATGLILRAGGVTALALDAGFAIERPAEAGKVIGWHLFRADASTPWLSVRRGTDNDEPLWRRFMVPPGHYRLVVAEAGTGATASEMNVIIQPGLTTTQVLPHIPLPRP